MEIWHAIHCRDMLVPGVEQGKIEESIMTMINKKDIFSDVL